MNNVNVLDISCKLFKKIKKYKAKIILLTSNFHKFEKKRNSEINNIKKIIIFLKSKKLKRK